MNQKYVLPAIVLGIAMIVSAYLLGNKWVDAKTSERYVTVKGLSERKVTADKAWYSINVQYGASSTAEIQNSMSRIEKQVKDYLKQYGFTDDEMSIGAINIYANTYEGAPSPYNANIRISVNTDDISKVQKASQSVTDLIAKGLLIQTDKWASGPKYYFTEFKSLKTEMLAEATKEAKKAAEEFANNSGSSVGQIRRANQGVFQILPANQTQDDQLFSVDKLVRVVSTFDYYLD